LATRSRRSCRGCEPRDRRWPAARSGKQRLSDCETSSDLRDIDMAGFIAPDRQAVALGPKIPGQLRGSSTGRSAPAGAASRLLDGRQQQTSSRPASGVAVGNAAKQRRHFIKGWSACEMQMTSSSPPPYSAAARHRGVLNDTPRSGSASPACRREEHRDAIAPSTTGVDNGRRRSDGCRPRHIPFTPIGGVRAKAWSGS